MWLLLRKIERLSGVPGRVPLQQEITMVHYKKQLHISGHQRR
jgi:hypothetical protein